MFVFTFLSIQRKIGLLKASRNGVVPVQENLKMRFFNFIFILTKCQANMCERATDPNQVGSLSRHYRDLYDYPAKILCSVTFQIFNYIIEIFTYQTNLSWNGSKSFIKNIIMRKENLFILLAALSQSFTNALLTTNSRLRESRVS